MTYSRYKKQNVYKYTMIIMNPLGNKNIFNIYEVTANKPWKFVIIEKQWKEKKTSNIYVDENHTYNENNMLKIVICDEEFICENN